MSGDRRQRDRALDVARSFIVQAPAGSGKTELLIQRYLALLAHVDLPEQIVAITFTRKAAAEMRCRVLAALADAAAGKVPDEPHRVRTIDLATAALARARRLGWDLELQPQRLRIDTLDAMNAWLAQRLSVLAGGVGGAQLVEKPVDCYELAIRRTLEALDAEGELGSALRCLLRGLDNNTARMERMLRELLPKRDQWLPYVAAGSDAELRRVLEAALRRLVEEALQDVARVLPATLLMQIVPLLRHVAANAERPDVAARFAAWRAPDASLAARLETLEAWRAVPELLLTRSKHTWKRRLTAADGFGREHAAMRERLSALIAAYESDEEIRAALQSLRELPRGAYSAGEWQLLAALRRALRHLVAELKVVFGDRQSVDFVELALAAQQALGSVDEPSELLLALDRRIQHVLVDEFQDTSHTQLRLLRLLTGGWEPEDGRTLFLVGDPMQSIYRFRQADMSLFLKTQAHGVGQVACEPLVLDSNFRSAPPVVAWVNTAFASIFPAEDDIGSGAARFHPCTAARAAGGDQTVHWHALRGDEAELEIERVVAVLREESTRYPQGSIAVLVRSRSHLFGLHERLRASGLAVHAVELEAPSRQQIVQDLIALTRALSHLGDRIAWLAILRAPWCGLSWRDLHALSAADHDRAVWSLMHDDGLLDGLSSDGRARLLHTREILANAIERRSEDAFEGWIEKTWLALGGAACLDFVEQTATVERFFAALGELAHNGDLDDPAALEERFSEPYGHGDPPRESGIEIMTIHRAKGLEFDTVVLLGLGRKPRADPARALYWLERTADDGSEDLLLAPLATAMDRASSLTDFIKRADAVRDRAESMRLLYVATTRARDRLHLIAQIRSDAARPPVNSLLEPLWPQFEHRFPEAAAAAVEAVAKPAFITPRLRRLRQPVVPLPKRGSPEPEVVRPEFMWASHAAVEIGTLVHAALQEIGRSGLGDWTAEAVRCRRRRFQHELALAGVDADQLEVSAQRVIDALCAVLNDRRGRWLLGDHAHAASELPLTLRGVGGLEHIRIDRTFVDEAGRRWIVDFKTSLHEGGGRDAFLDSEVERCRGQLARYAAAMSETEERPIRLGLYFPLLQAFRSWPAAEPA